MAEASQAETVFNLPENANYTPEGLAFNFRSMLNRRRPNANEELEAVAGFMETMIAEGIDGKAIYNVLKARGKHTETIWEFRKRVCNEHNAAKAKEVDPYAKMTAHAEEELKRRESGH
jgi:hypothetical protein